MPNDDKNKNTDLTGDGFTGSASTGTNELNTNSVNPPPPQSVATSSTSTTNPPPPSTITNDAPPLTVSANVGDTAPPPPPPTPATGMGSDSSSAPGTLPPGTPQGTGESAKMITTPAGKSRKIGKKTILAVLGGLLLVGGIAAGVVLVQRQQDIREKAGSIGQWGCLSEQGLAITSNSSRGSAGDLGYKPLSSTDANNYSMGDTVSFQTRLKNTTGSPISTLYVFVASKVIEAPKGQAPADNLNEAQMYQIHEGQGTIQETIYNSGKIPVSFSAGEEKYISDSWTATECGYYQIDMMVDDFVVNQGNNCPADKVVAAGFIKVTGCGTASCNKVTAYDVSWNELAQADLQNLKAGDVVYFSVAGTASGGSFNKARFDFDGTGWKAEVTATVPGKTSEFYDTYTIPEGVTRFSINAQINHETEGWK